MKTCGDWQTLLRVLNEIERLRRLGLDGRADEFTREWIAAAEDAIGTEAAESEFDADSTALDALQDSFTPEQ